MRCLVLLQKVETSDTKLSNVTLESIGVWLMSILIVLRMITIVCGLGYTLRGIKALAVSNDQDRDFDAPH
jgi:hypothetical protein